MDIDHRSKLPKIVSVFIEVILVFTLGLFGTSCNVEQQTLGANEAVVNISNHVDLNEVPVLSSTPNRAVKMVSCTNAKGRDLSLCNITAPDWKDNSDPLYPFEITYADVDLNSDGLKETVVWESSWAGTSGGIFVVLASNKAAFLKKFDTEMTWSPVIMLPTKHHGWSDLAYLQNGGGLKTEYIIAEYNGRSYSASSTSETQPEGEIIIQKNWEESYFGPIEK